MSSSASVPLQFAELMSDSAHRLHVGCVLRSGKGWVEVSVPRGLALGSSTLLVRFHPHPQSFAVSTLWRLVDSVGLQFLEPEPEWLSGS